MKSVLIGKEGEEEREEEGGTNRSIAV